ncbi:hypothetical protein ACQJBY_052770 [Aegilops geniculata]
MEWYYREVEAERTRPFSVRPPTSFPHGASPSGGSSSSASPLVPEQQLPPPSPPSRGETSHHRPEYADVFMPLVVDMAHSRRFAYTLIDPASPSPGDLLRRALELHAGNPSVGLAASHYGAMMVIFSSDGVREHAMRHFPLPFEGHVVTLERPESGENRFGWEYTCFAQLSATGFPLEHWHEGGIHNAFRSVGNVYCIDPLRLNDLDFSAVRLVIRLEHQDDVPHALFIRNFDDDLSTEVRIRRVRFWSIAKDGSSVSSLHFEGDGGSSPRSPPRGPRSSGMDDIDTLSLRGFDYLSLEPRPAAPAPLDDFPGAQQSASMAAFRRQLGCRMAGLLSEPFPPRWCAIFPPATPLLPEEGSDSISSDPSSDGGCALLLSSPVMLPSELADEDHEHAALKRRGRHKRAVDTNHTGRRSSRLARKEPSGYVKMLDRAKAAKAARFDTSKGSPRLRAAVRAAGIGIDDGAPAPLSLCQLCALGEPCGIDLDALAAGARAEMAYGAP